MFQKCWLEDENQVSSTKIGGHNGIKSFLFFFNFQKNVKMLLSEIKFGQFLGVSSLTYLHCKSNKLLNFFTFIWQFVYPKLPKITWNAPKINISPKTTKIYRQTNPPSAPKMAQNYQNNWPKITKNGPKRTNMAHNLSKTAKWAKLVQNISKLLKTA